MQMSTKRLRKKLKMFINETLIAVFFRLFNFCLVIGLAAYGFKKYIMPGIRDAMIKDEAEREFLIAEQHVLERRLTDLQEVLQQDADVYKCYAAKIDEWKKVVAHQEVLCQKECEARQTAFVIKEKNKIEWRNKMALQSLVAKKVVEDLHTSLTQHFKKNDAGEAYLEDIIHFMNEKSL